MANSENLTPEEVVKLYRAMLKVELACTSMAKWLKNPTPKLKSWLNDLDEKINRGQYDINDYIFFTIRYTAFEEELIKRGEL